jgi:hypothetical protein
MSLVLGCAVGEAPGDVNFAGGDGFAGDGSDDDDGTDADGGDLPLGDGDGDGDGDCDGDPLTGQGGCEVDLTVANVNHCGICNKSCIVAGTALTCLPQTGTCSGSVTYDGAAFEDTYVDEDKSGSNFGTDTELLVDGDSTNNILDSYDYRTLLRIVDLGLPAGYPITVTAASLSLRCTDSGGSSDVSLVAGMWSESTVTWSNRPPTGSSFASLTCSGTGWKTLDVKSAMTAWATGTPNHGIEISTSAADGTDWGSRESSNPPSLQVTLSY